MDTPPINDNFDPPSALLRPEPDFQLTPIEDLPGFWQDHYLEAERLLAIGNDDNVRKAQVHATLASILVGHCGSSVPYRQGPMLTREQAIKARGKGK